jgi:CsoR family transcriptional regulator, copper-sensing transcriptional repressor
MTGIGRATVAPVRSPGPRQDAEVVARLRRATGQLAGVTGMVENGRYCIDVLDQLAAVSAAVDAVALLVLSDHINACVRAAIESGETDEKVAELDAAVRRYVRSR